jgi:hypothetical protein
MRLNPDRATPPTDGLGTRRTGRPACWRASLQNAFHQLLRCNVRGTLASKNELRRTMRLDPTEKPLWPVVGASGRERSRKGKFHVRQISCFDYLELALRLAQSARSRAQGRQSEPCDVNRARGPGPGTSRRTDVGQTMEPVLRVTGLLSDARDALLHRSRKVRPPGRTSGAGTRFWGWRPGGRAVSLRLSGCSPARAGEDAGPSARIPCHAFALGKSSRPVIHGMLTRANCDFGNLL